MIRVLSKLYYSLKIKNAIRYCVRGKNRISELACVDDHERQYINVLLAKYLSNIYAEGEIEVLSRTDHTVIFFNGTDSQIIIR